jgi:5-methylcytosine-specific restriction protein A
MQLSRLLNRLPIHAIDTRNANFRNPQGVSMKLGHFLAIDPEYSGTGLRRVGKLDREIWHAFARDSDKLRLTAAAISKSASEMAETSVAYDSSQDDDEFPEGKILTRLHQRKERNRRATDHKKRHVLQATSRLACEACHFDFAATYGDLGYGFAECHHTIPVAELTENHRTRLADLAILCANCHRMIHKSRPMLTVQALRVIIERHHTQAQTQHTKDGEALTLYTAHQIASLVCASEGLCAHVCTNNFGEGCALRHITGGGR